VLVTPVRHAIDSSAFVLHMAMTSDINGAMRRGTGDLINTDPLLGPLQNNGGPTSTHALLPGSPAIDAGDPSFTPPPWYDQRGPNFWRLRNDRIDIGSFEVQAGTKVTPTPTPTPYSDRDTNSDAQAFSNTETASESAPSSNTALKNGYQ
jgi:hypothetical protein